MATVGKIKADLQVSTGQARRDVGLMKDDFRSLGAVIRERKTDFTLVENAAKAQAEATKRAAAEARKAAQEQAAVAREARVAAQEATRNARELAAAAKDAAPELKKAAQEQAAAAKEASREAKENARQQADIARQARAASQEQAAVAREARQIAAEARRAAQEQAKAHAEAEKAAAAQKVALQEVGTTAATVFAVLAIGIAAATTNTAQMEQELANLKAVTGAAADELERAKAAAEQFGPSNGIVAPQSVAAITEFVKAGVDMERLLSGELKDAQDLMVAGELDVAEAAAHASYALNTYKDDLLSIKDIANAEAGAANASATSVREMGDAHRQLGPVAAQLNHDFESTNTLLAIFANNGLRGSDAGKCVPPMLATA